MTTSLYSQESLQTIYAQFLNQLILGLTQQQDLGQIGTFLPISAPGVLTTTAASGTGNLTGAYSYVVTYITGSADGSGGLHPAGETQAGTTSTAVNVTSQNISLSAIPQGPAGTIARNIYRTKAGGSTYYFDFQIPDNTTATWMDSTTDANLGATVAPLVNTTGTVLSSILKILDGSQITSGSTLTNNGTITGGTVEPDSLGTFVLPTSNLPSSVAQTNLGNTFTQSQTFSGLITPNGGIAGALGANGADGSGNPIGRNLLLESSFQFGGAFWSGIGQNGFTIGAGTADWADLTVLLNTTSASNASVSSARIPCSANVTLMLSGEMFASGVTSGIIQLVINAYKSDGSYLGQSGVSPTNSSKWKRYSVQFTTPTNTSYVQIICQMSAGIANTNAGWRRIKLEPVQNTGSAGTGVLIATPYTTEGDILAEYILRAFDYLMGNNAMAGAKLTYTYNADSTINTATATGTVQGTCTYAYSSGSVSTATCQLTWPWAINMTRTFSYDSNSRLSYYTDSLFS